MDIMITVITSILSAFFIFASSIKISAWQKKIFDIQLSFFVKYGFNRQIMLLVGCVELTGAILIWFEGCPVLLGAMALAGTSLGAIFCHLKFDTWKDGIPAMVTLTLSAILMYLNIDLLIGVL